MSNTTRCEYCGRELEPRYVVVGEKRYPTGYAPCHCEGAAAARVAALEEEERKIANEKHQAEVRRLRNAGLPERYMNAEHPQADALCDLWADDIGFYIDGEWGTGKTLLASAAFRKLCLMGYSSRFVVVPTLMESMRSRKVEDRDQTERLATVDVLVLDDLGKETPTPYACERLFDIVNTRYNANLPIGITSNFTRGEIAQKLTEGDIGRSIASRLCEMTRRVHLDGEDRRLRHG